MDWDKKEDQKSIQELWETIRNYSAEAAKAICELDSVSGNDATEEFPDPILISDRVSIEFVLFYIHLLNRFAVSIIDEKKLSQLVAEFIDRTVRAIPAIARLNKTERSDMKHGGWYFVQFLVRQDEYSQFEILMSEDLSENSAFQRFGENISRAMGMDSQHVSSTSCQAYVVASLNQLDLNRFIESIGDLG